MDAQLRRSLEEELAKELGLVIDDESDPPYLGGNNFTVGTVWEALLRERAERNRLLRERMALTHTWWTEQRV